MVAENLGMPEHEQLDDQVYQATPKRRLSMRDLLNKLLCDHAGLSQEQI